MRKACLALIISFFAVNSIAQTEPDVEKDTYRERLGLRAGYVATTSQLADNFGGGLSLALHYVQGIKEPFYIDFSFGAFWMGSPAMADTTFQNFDNTSLRVVTFLIAPRLEMPIGRKTNFYVSAGGGLYTVSLLLDQAFREFNLTNNHLGVNAGAGLTHRVAKNWFLQASAQLDKFWTSTTGDDIFFIYSEGDQDPVFYQVTVGVMLRLF